MLEIRRPKVATAFEPFTFHLARLTALGLTAGNSNLQRKMCRIFHLNFGSGQWGKL